MKIMSSFSNILNNNIYSNVKDGDVTQDREVTHNVTGVIKGNNSTTP